MKKILFSILVLSSIASNAQDPEDILRLSWFAPNGTPRSNALGGAMGSLGGDVSSNHINPAGLGFYKKGEFLISPQFVSKSNTYNYFGNERSMQDSRMSIGTIGMVFADGQRKGNATSSAFSISFTKIADYNNSHSFRGQNSYSSFTEKFADQLYYDGASLKQAEENYVYGSSLALHSKLVEPILDINGNVTDYKSTVPFAAGLNQFYDAETSGSYNELAFGWAGNYQDKLYLGGSIIMPMINYTRALNYGESESSTNNGIFDFYENYSSKGFGLGAKLGIIYKPESYLRFGFSFHTPQIISFRDAVNASMYSNEYPDGLSSTDLIRSYNNIYPHNYSYNLQTPLKTIFSTSYFFAAPNKPTQPLGFISADVEWVNYAGTKFYSNEVDQSVTDYYHSLNATIKNNYKNNFNIKVGSEFKLTSNWLLRAGIAYYGSPYKDESMKASHLVLSGGVGYRSGKHFIDLTVMNTRTTDAVFPYRLVDKDNYYAKYTGNQLLFSIGYGIKFN